MDLSLTETQHLFVDSVSRYLNSEYPLSHRQTLVSTDLGYSEAHWQTFAELGWTGLALPEAFDGLGGDLIDRMLLHEQLGKGLVLEPFLATLGLCVPAILWGDQMSKKRCFIPRRNRPAIHGSSDPGGKRPTQFARHRDKCINE